MMLRSLFSVSWRSRCLDVEVRLRSWRAGKRFFDLRRAGSLI